VIEILAAVTGAMVGVAGIGATQLIRKNGDNREVIAKLTVGVDHIGQELTALRADMKMDRQEMYSRLNECEQRLSVIESQKKRY